MPVLHIFPEEMCCSCVCTTFFVKLIKNLVFCYKFGHHLFCSLLLSEVVVVIVNCGGCDSMQWSGRVLDHLRTIVCHD